MSLQVRLLLCVLASGCASKTEVEPVADAAIEGHAGETAGRDAGADRDEKARVDAGGDGEGDNAVSPEDSSASDGDASRACFKEVESVEGKTSTGCEPIPAACSATVTCACVMTALGVADNPAWSCTVSGGFVVVSTVPSSTPMPGQ